MKAKAKTQSWRGGVMAHAQEQRRVDLGRSHRATIEKRADDRARLRLDAAWDLRVGERLLVDTSFETLAADVYAVHPHHLIDVKLLAPLLDTSKRVHLRRTAP